MLGELERLINFIESKYIDLNEKWKKSIYYSEINLRSNLVCDILEKREILDNIISYREFINENNIQLIIDLKQFNTNKSKVNIRTKSRNSIEYKIKNYIENHENGKVAVNKCFNDLLGIRIICSDEITHSQIKDLVNDKYNNLKCIEAIRGEYKATHLYFKKDNFNFQWELQIWNKSDEINNINSHERYKQDYVLWENENKKGE